MELDTARQHEREKYEAIYAGAETVPATGGYGRTNHWRKAWPYINALRASSMCDVGTGYGDFPKKCRDEGMALAIGIDFAMPEEAQHDSDHLRLLKAPAHAIPLLDKSVEYVTAFDVLEHLVPDEVDGVLREFLRVATKGFVFSISYQPSKITLKGETLHPTVRREDWWVGRIQSATGPRVQKRGRYLFCALPNVPEPIEKLLESTKPPRRAVVLGKGPSLSRYRPEDFPGEFVVGLNEASESFRCDWSLYIDARFRVLDLPESTTVIRPSQRAEFHDGRGYVFELETTPRSLTRTTGAAATTLLARWGVKDIIYIGFDGWDTADGPANAPCLKRVIAERGNADYSRENGHIAVALAHADVTPVWWHRTVSRQTIVEHLQDKKVLVMGNGAGHKPNEPFNRAVHMNAGLGGYRTDIWVNNTFSPRGFEDVLYTFILRLNGEDNGRRLFEVYPQEAQWKTHFAMPHEFEACCRAVGYARPSTGVQTLFWLLENTRTAELVVAGFDFFTSSRAASCHNPHLERNYVESLAATGRIRLEMNHGRQCTAQ